MNLCLQAFHALSWRDLEGTCRLWTPAGRATGPGFWVPLHSLHEHWSCKVPVTRHKATRNHQTQTLRLGLEAERGSKTPHSDKCHKGYRCFPLSHRVSIPALQICSFVVTNPGNGAVVDSAAWAENPAAFLDLLFPSHPCRVLPLNLKSCWPLNSPAPVQASVICLRQQLLSASTLGSYSPFSTQQLECFFTEVSWMSFSYLQPIGSFSLYLGEWLRSHDLGGL